jgi:hypothetical protein
MKSMVYALLAVVFGFAVSGCVTCQECGSLKRSNEVARSFLAGEIVAGYSYYYNGTELRPSAVMAIDSSYTVTAQFWKPVGRSGKELSEWLSRAVNWKGVGQRNRIGAEILNPEGVQIGIYFSKYDNLVTKFQNDREIQVYPPSYQAGSGKGRDDKDSD